MKSEKVTLEAYLSAEFAAKKICAFAIGDPSLPLFYSWKRDLIRCRMYPWYTEKGVPRIRTVRPHRVRGPHKHRIPAINVGNYHG